MRALLPVLTVLLPLAAGYASAQQQTGPSFDCRKAKSPLEKDICTSPKLAALDRRVAEEYAAALKRLDEKSATALRQDQRWFQGVLQIGLEHDAGLAKKDRIFDLPGTMEERVSFLSGLRPVPAGTWAGTWKNFVGEIEIEEKDGKLKVSAGAAKPVTGNWVCNLEGSARQEGDALVITQDEEADGWTYRLARAGDHAVFSQKGPKGEEFSSPTCGMNGSMTGSYFPTTKKAGK